MKNVMRLLLVVVGIINLFPVIGVFSPEILSSLYGIDTPAGDLLILLRHRSLLLGVVGLIIIVSAFKRDLQKTALVIGMVSMVGFIVIAFLQGGIGAEIQSVINLDLFAIAGLSFAAILRLRLVEKAESK